MKQILFATVSLLAFSSTSHADSGAHGMRWIELSMSSGDSIRVDGDWRITHFHSLQLNAELARHDGEMVGLVTGHVHLEPSPGRRYGFMLGIADVDGREARAAHVGISGAIEGWGRLDNMTFAGASSIGWASGGVDFIAAEGRADTRISPTITASLGAQVAEFDEAVISVLAWEIDARVDWSIQDGPAYVYAKAARKGLSGRGGQAPQNRIELGVTWRFGGKGAAPLPARNPITQMMAVGVF